MAQEKATPLPGHMPAATFKAQRLDLVGRVKETGAENINTKHGRRVARLVPYEDTAAKALFGSMKGTILNFERPLDPIDGDYDSDKT